MRSDLYELVERKLLLWTIFISSSGECIQYSIQNYCTWLLVGYKHICTCVPCPSILAAALVLRYQSLVAYGAVQNCGAPQSSVERLS